MSDMSKIDDAIHDLGERAEKIGLYLRGHGYATEDPETGARLMSGEIGAIDAMAEGYQIMVMTTFAIGDMAFDRSVTNPEQDRVDRQAQIMLPDAAEELREKLRRRVEEGKGIFDDED